MITENQFTAEELATAMTANPALLAVMKTHFATDGSVLRTKAEDEAFRTDFEANVIARKTSEIATKIEADVKELTGIEKSSPDQKYFDYLKYAIGEKVKGVDALTTELNALKTNPASKPTDAARIQQLEEAIATEQTKVTKLQADHVTEVNRLKIEGKLEGYMSGLKFKEGIPQAMVDIFKKQQMDELVKTAKVNEDGSISVLDPNGQPLVGADYKPKAIDVILKDRFGDALDDGQQQQGGGTGPNSQGKANGQQQQQGAGSYVKLTALPTGVKSKVQLTEHLMKSGLTDDRPEFQEAFDTFGKDLPLNAPA